MSVQSWSFEYNSKHDVSVLPIPNGDEVPLPPRNMWKGGAKVIATLNTNDDRKSYYVTITEDVYLESESDHLAGFVEHNGPGFLAKGLARKFATGLGGGVVGGVVGGLVGVLIPSPIAKEKFWRSKTSSEIPVTVVILGF